MSGHPPTLHLPAPEKLVPSKFGLTYIFAILSLVGLLGSVIGAFVDKEQFAYSWFYAFYFFFTIAMGAFFWVVLHHVCDSAWSVLIRRSLENILPLFFVFLILFIPLLLPGVCEVLWKWLSLDSSDHELARRAGYLNGGFFFIRVIIYFTFFCLAGNYFRSRSVEQDYNGNPVLTRNMNKHSYMAMVIFGVLVTFVGIDWLMGLDWHWSSSLFGVYNFTICAQAGMAAAIVLVALLQSAGFLRAVNAEHYYLMGKLLFGFTIFWAYIAFGQYLLIWYGNIPEETIFYNDHNRGYWYLFTYLIVVGKFMFPVIYLLAQDTKKSLRALTTIAVWILFMHGIELYWFIMPYAHAKTILPSLQDFFAFLTIGSILGFAYLRICSWASLIPTRDPRLVECLTITN